MPRAPGKKVVEEAGGPSKAWLDSYADAMTLLLAFFILLYASSIIDEDLFEDFKIGVADALGQPSPVSDGGRGILDRGNGVATMVAAPPTVDESASGADGGESTLDTPDNLEALHEATAANVEDLVEELRRKIAEVEAEEFVEIVNDPRGVIIRFDSQVLFRSGAARVLPDGVTVLSQVAGVLAGLDNLLVVEGHTDNVPTGGTQWPTNWELSTARATTVLRYLAEIEKIPPVRLSAAGYSDTRPRASNKNADGRGKNRRVELVVLVAPYSETLAPIDGATFPAPLTGDAAIENPVQAEIVTDGLFDLDAGRPIEDSS